MMKYTYVVKTAAFAILLCVAPTVDQTYNRRLGLWQWLQRCKAA